MIRQLLTSSLVRAARSARQVPCRLHRAHQLRRFTSNPQPPSDEHLAAFTAAFQKTKVFKKLASHPEAIKSLEDLTRILQDAGVDLTSGQKPSALKMAKLAMSSTFREQIKKVAEEMKKAGVDFNSKEVMDEIMALKKAGPPK
ncbi:hypothetical protein LshimejAT787_0104920 [Lyophyllum shimeji]|uniref:Uncharacterized protein n=1 Tax=Lyophyllum shimeji TaxID=47721 RepID=A0A9P3UHW2_LYOSH|nr:hypothetical protein LshimejAT787_0104920 [Lyophyllum shimeji]